MRKALVVGINYYESGSGLFGCIQDACSVKTVLERHGDGSLNFDVHFLTAAKAKDAVSRAALKDAITELFNGESEVALLYFAGHGHIEATGGYILASDSKRGDEGVPLMDALSLANGSKAKNKIIVLDSCHSGIAGTPPTGGEGSFLSEGLTILTASTADQYATEANGSVFKTNVKSFVSLRKVQPPISRSFSRSPDLSSVCHALNGELSGHAICWQPSIQSRQLSVTVG